MEKKDFFVIFDQNEDYDVLFHVPTSKVFKVKDGNSVLAKNDHELYLLTKLEKTEAILSEKKKGFGEGKIGLTFMSARTCNLACQYCFAGQGEYGECSEKPKYMTLDNYINAVEHVVENMYPEGVMSISFFGGEPLLNIKVIKAFVIFIHEYFNEKQLDIPRISISTNGVTLDEETVEFFSKYAIAVGLSLDGPKEINDFGRKSKDDSFSYFDMLNKKIKLLRKYNVYYAFQMTLTNKHLEEYKEGIVDEWFKELDLFNDTNISLIPVTSDIEKFGIVSEEDFEKLKSLTVEITRYFMGQLKQKKYYKIASGLVAPMIQVMNNKFHGSCSAGRSVFVDTDGEIYPCHMFCNDSNFSLGNVKEETIHRTKIERNISVSRLDSEVCKGCIARKVCSTWCKGLQYIVNNDQNKPLRERCEFQKAVLEENIRELARLNEQSETGQLFLDNMKGLKSKLNSLGVS